MSVSLQFFFIRFFIIAFTTKILSLDFFFILPSSHSVIYLVVINKWGTHHYRIICLRYCYAQQLEKFLCN